MNNSDRCWSWFIIFIFLIAFLGWGLNVVKLIRLDFRAPYKAEFIRIVGLSPLGAVIGYVHLKDY